MKSRSIEKNIETNFSQLKENTRFLILIIIKNFPLTSKKGFLYFKTSDGFISFLRMKITKSVLILSFFVLLGIGAFSYIDYLFASQEGIVREYNPISGYWEPVENVSMKEIIREGMVENSFFDFHSDSSFQKFLDDTHAMSTSYIPTDLVKIHSDFTFNKSSTYQLRQEAAEQFADMARAFSNAFDFKSRISITSAYRSSAFQKSLAKNCSTTRCATPGTSEHEAGLALDLGVNGGNILGNNGKYYQRLLDNAHEYGFHNTYQKGEEIDGKMVEPWHRRYVGKSLATYLHDSNQTIAEYYYTLYPNK